MALLMGMPPDCYDDAAAESHFDPSASSLILIRHTLVGGITLQTIGYFVIRKIIRIEV